MLGQVRKVSVAGDKNDETPSMGQPLLDESEKRDRTNQMLLAAAEIDYQEDIIRERESGINHIHRDVNRINQLFQDVAIHVTQQGESLDHIEANVTSARDQTANANRQLRTASERGPSVRRNLFCLLLVFVLILFVIVLLKISLSPLAINGPTFK